MSAKTALQTLSDTALAGAIRQLTASGEWPYRLRQLHTEKNLRRSRQS